MSAPPCAPLFGPHVSAVRRPFPPCLIYFSHQTASNMSIYMSYEYRVLTLLRTGSSVRFRRGTPLGSVQSTKTSPSPAERVGGVTARRTSCLDFRDSLAFSFSSRLSVPRGLATSPPRHRVTNYGAATEARAQAGRQEEKGCQKNKKPIDWSIKTSCSMSV